MTSDGIRYSNIEPDQEMSAAPCSTAVTARPRRNQCRAGTSLLAIATKLARRASEASRSSQLGSRASPGGGGANRQKPALPIEQEAELHRVGHRARRRLDACQAPLQAAGFLVRLPDIAAPTLDRALRRLRPEEYVGARAGAEFAGQRSRDVDQGRGMSCAVRELLRELPGHDRAAAQRGREDIERVFDLTGRDHLGLMVGGKCTQGLARESKGIGDTGKRLAT